MIQFSGRRHTGKGILSAIIGFLIIIGFISISIVSGLNGGNGGFLIGILGLLLFLLAICGFILSYKSLKERDIFYRFPMIGIITNGLMLMLLMLIYILGFIS